MSRKRSKRALVRHRQVPLWKKLLFASVVCLAFFALVELTLWTVGVATLIEGEDPFRGFSGLVTVFEADGDLYRTRRSNLGSFNDQSFLVKKPDDSFRIFCLGGSSSHGFPWGAEAAFPSIVSEAATTSHPELHVEMVNASGVAYAMHRLNIVADELLSYQPDVFIIYSGHNEFVEPAFFDALKRRSTARTHLEYTLAHSRTYSGLHALFSRFDQEKSSTADDFGPVVRPDQTRVFSSEEKEAIVAEFRWRLGRLVSRAQTMDVKVVLATVPANLHQWRPEASAGIAVLSEADRQNWSDQFSSGKRLLDAGKFTEATAHLEQAARMAPLHAETQFLLAQAHEGLDQWDAARAAYQRACDADASPNRRISEINDAIRDVAREHGTVLVDVDRVFEQHSEHGLVGLNLIEDFVHPTRGGHEIIAWHVWDAMERAGWFGNKTPADRSIFDTLIANRSRQPTKNNKATWFYNQGVLLEKQNQAEAAIEKYRQALELAPGYPMALLNLGALLIQQGEHIEAIGVIQRLIEIDPDSAEAHNGLGAALHSVGRTKEAVAHYRNALQLKPEFAGAHYNLGRAMQSVGQLETAVKHYREAVRIKPDYVQAHCNWGNVLQRLGRQGEAVGHYQQAVQIDPDSAIAHVNWGNVLVQQQRFEQAIARYKQAVRIKPDFAEAHSNLGDTLLQMGRHDLAVTHYQEAVRIQPNSVRAYNNWGVALMQQKKLHEAARTFQQALRVQPNFEDARHNFRRVQQLIQQKSRQTDSDPK